MCVRRCCKGQPGNAILFISPADDISETQLGLITGEGVYQKILPECYRILFEKQDDGRAAKFKIPFFLSPQDGTGFSVIYDLSYHQCADLHLHNISQVGGVNDRIFPAVFFVDGKMLPSDGIYRVKDTWDAVILDWCPVAA